MKGVRSDLRPGKQGKPDPGPLMQRAKKIAVVSTVMLGNGDPAEAERLSPLSLLQCSLVKIGRPHRANAWRTPEVIANFVAWHLFSPKYGLSRF